LPEAATRDAPAPAYVPPQYSLQTQLIEIWEELLHRRGIGIRDDFFELGGHSLLVARMLSVVAERLGVRLPFGVFFTEATVERMALLIKDGQIQQAADHSWVVLNKQASKAPFFFLHGDYGGGGFFCRSLARYSGGDRPFYALHPAGLHDDPIPATIEEMAALKLQDLRKIQPKGPYFLGGYCNGALVAYEMARQIEATGGEAPLVVMLYADGSNAQWQSLQRLLGAVSQLRGEDTVARQRRFLRGREIFGFWLAVRAHYLKTAANLIKKNPAEQARRIVNKVGRMFSRLCGQKLPPSFPPPPPAKPKSVFNRARTDAYCAAVYSYVPKRFGGRIVLLWPEEEKNGPPPGTFGWTEVCDDIRFVQVPGGHDSCIERDSNLRAAGQEMGRALADFEKETGQASS
jgi:thioesterase domain-containing protein